MLTLRVRTGVGQESSQTRRNGDPCQTGAQSFEALSLIPYIGVHVDVAYSSINTAFPIGLAMVLLCCHRTDDGNRKDVGAHKRLNPSVTLTLIHWQLSADRSCELDSG